MICTVESFSINELRSLKLSFTFITKAFFASEGLIVFAISCPLTFPGN